MRPLVLVEAPVADAQVSRRDRRAGTALSLCYIATGIAAHATAAVLLVLWGGAIVAGGWASPHALGLTHVIALGFITSVAIGVLYHITPLAFGRPLRVIGAGFAVWLLYALALVTFVSGLATGNDTLMAAGAAAMGTAVMCVLAHIGTVIATSRRRAPMHRFQAIALTWLGVLALLGVLLALTLAVPLPLDASRLLAAKVVVAVGGWLGTLVLGVLYQLMPMFSPARALARYQRHVLAFLMLAVVTAALTAGVGAHAALRMAAGACWVIAWCLFARDALQHTRHRMDAAWTPASAGQLLGLAVAGAGAVFALLAMSAEPPWPQLAVATALLGWAPLEIAANATRLVPFIVWQRQEPQRRPATYRAGPPAPGWAALGCFALACAAFDAGLLSHIAWLGTVTGIAALCGSGALALAALRGSAPP